MGAERSRAASGIAFALVAAACSAAHAETGDELREQVRKTEMAFAKTMADRDHAAFTKFLAQDTIWLGRSVMRGSKAVAEGWKTMQSALELGTADARLYLHAAAIAAQAGENGQAKIYARKAAKSAFSLLPGERMRLKLLNLV